MSKNYADLPCTRVRRHDREVTDETWRKALLQRVPIGVLATTYSGQPFLNSNLFVYDEVEHALCIQHG